MNKILDFLYNIFRSSFFLNAGPMLIIKYSTLRPLSHRYKIGDNYGDPTTGTEWDWSRRYTLKLLAETCVQRQTRPVSRSGVTRWNSFFFATATVASRCRSRKWFYFSWNLSRNGSSKKFHETDHVTWRNACWNLFRSAVAHKFQLKVSTCNGGLKGGWVG